MITIRYDIPQVGRPIIGACFKSYNSLEEARQAFISAMDLSSMTFSKIKDFYKTRISREIYKKLNSGPL